MTFFKLMTTTTIIGLISTTSFANSINFSQKTATGIISNVSFDQSGGGTNTIVANVTGDLAKLNIKQSGDGLEGNTDTVTIKSNPTYTNITEAGSVEIVTDGEGNSSTLTVLQSTGGSLDYKVNITGDENVLVADIGKVNSVLHLASIGDKITYDIDQIEAVDSSINSHKIIANIVEAGVETTASNVKLSQSGADNTINLGMVFSNDDPDVVGMTLNGGADVDIIQTAASASFISSGINVPTGGTLAINQVD